MKTLWKTVRNLIFYFIQSYILDSIGEVVKAMRNAEATQSEKKALEISEADCSILYYIAGFLIRALEKKYMRLKNKKDKEEKLGELENLKSIISEHTFTTRFSG